MKIINYVRRAKRKTGFEKFNILHAADNSHTFCGKELNEMWFIEDSTRLSKDSITCKKCVKVINAQ